MKKFGLIVLFLVLLFTSISFADEFKSVAQIPGSSGDDIWVIVERVIDGNTVQYIEKFEPLDFGTDPNDMYFVDCGSDDVDDLSHLEGETVSLLVDGVVDPNTYVVSGGSITPYATGTNYAVGLSYDSVFCSLPLVSYDRQYNASTSYLSKVSNLVLDLYETMSFNIGTDADHKSTQDIDELFTGIRPLEYPRGSWRAPCIFIDMNEPSAFTLRGITATLSTSYIE